MPIKDEIIIPRKGDQSIDGDFLPGAHGRWNIGSLLKKWRGIFAKNVNAQSYGKIYNGSIAPGMILVGYAGPGTTYTPTLSTTPQNLCALTITVPCNSIAVINGVGTAQCTVLTAVQDLYFYLYEGATLVQSVNKGSGYLYERSVVPVMWIRQIPAGSTTYYIKCRKPNTSNTVIGVNQSKLWIAAYA